MRINALYNSMGAKKWDNGMTIKEEQFCHMYVFGSEGEMSIRGNASECYRRIYGQGERKDNSIWVYACKLMAKPHVKQRIKELQSTILTKEWVLAGLQAEAENKDNKAADRIRSRELIGKSMGIFIDKVQEEIKFDALFTENDEK